jgi:hypothetical protein
MAHGVRNLLQESVMLSRYQIFAGAVVLTMCTGPVVAQQGPTSFKQLIEQGYEVKTMGTQGGLGVIILQKGKSVYSCFTFADDLNYPARTKPYIEKGILFDATQNRCGKMV